MFHSLETLFDFFEDFPQAAKSIRRNPPFLLGTFGYVIAGLSLFLAQSLGRSIPVSSSLSISVGFYCMWQLGMGFVLTSLIHLVLEIGGVRGSALGLYVLLGLSSLVWTLAVPATLLSTLLLPSSRWIGPVLFLVLWLLTLVLKTFSVAKNYEIGLGPAWLVLVLPYLLAIPLLLFLFVLVIWGISVQFLRFF